MTGLPWHSVHDLTWEPGWVSVPLGEQRRRPTAICERDAWILDSGDSQWIDVPPARVQLVVALDYPRWLSFGRLLRRTGPVGGPEAICNENGGTLRKAVSSDSIMKCHFRSFDRKRQRIRAWQIDPEGPAVQRLRQPRRAADRLRSIERGTADRAARGKPARSVR